MVRDVVVSVGEITTIDPVGSLGGEPFDAIDCPAGQIAIGANIRAGGSVDAMGLICGTPTIQ